MVAQLKNEILCKAKLANEYSGGTNIIQNNDKQTKLHIFKLTVAARCDLQKCRVLLKKSLRMAGINNLLVCYLVPNHKLDEGYEAIIQNYTSEARTYTYRAYIVITNF